MFAPPVDYATSGRVSTTERVLQNSDLFKQLIEEHKAKAVSSSGPQEENEGDEPDIMVCVRYRPLLPNERAGNNFGCAGTEGVDITAIYKPDFKVDNTPLVKTEKFITDKAFSDAHDNNYVYQATGAKLLPLALGGGVGTLFAYGQTSAGKTHTLIGVQSYIAKNIFQSADAYMAKFTQQQPQLQEQEKQRLQISASFFELLGKNAFDLLNEKTPIAILEDKFGDIQLQGLTERVVSSPEEFLVAIESAAQLRQTATTLRNDTSSRSHAVCRVRIHNPLVPSAEDGILMLVDLAGSERAADSKNHDAERLAETKEINSSLMALKDCIRARAIAATSPSKFVHVPYRASKLTVLLKDAFELASMRATKTIVIAHISPCATDVAHSLNTLRYIQPLKVQAPKSFKFEFDELNPATWDHEYLTEWVWNTSNNKIDPKILCPYESGLQLCRIPESEFIRRVLLNPAIEDEKKAKVFYLKLWTLVVDARTRQRTEKTAVSATDMQAHRRKMKEKSKSDDDARSVTNKSTAAVRNRSVKK